MAAIAAGLSNRAAASPISATPAPPIPAERVDPGNEPRTLCEANDVESKTSRRNVQRNRHREPLRILSTPFSRRLLSTFPLAAVSRRVTASPQPHDVEPRVQHGRYCG